MSTTTPNLGLFKYNTTTDTAVPFSIDNALNANWDIIDQRCGASRNIGEIIASTIPLTDAGLHLLDGALIQGSGSYSAFVTYIAGLVSTYPNLFVTESAWQSAITTYGVCGKFVYDSTNNTVRLPKYNSKIYTGGGTAPVIGNGISLGLTDGINNGGFAWNNGGGNAVLKGPIQQFSGVAVGTSNSGSTYILTQNVALGVTTDPTKSGLIADLSGITTSLDGYYYIVVATSTKTDIQVDIDDIATDLNGKCDKADLQEVQCVIETYSDGTSWYRVYSDGWCEQGSLYYKGSSCQGNNTIEFLLPFKNISYTLTGMPFHTSTSYDLCEVYASRTKSSTVLYIGSAVFGFMWKVCGYIEV